MVTNNIISDIIPFLVSKPIWQRIGFLLQSVSGLTMLLDIVGDNRLTELQNVIDKKIKSFNLNLGSFLNEDKDSSKMIIFLISTIIFLGYNVTIGTNFKNLKDLNIIFLNSFYISIFLLFGSFFVYIHNNISQMYIDHKISHKKFRELRVLLLIPMIIFIVILSCFINHVSITYTSIFSFIIAFILTLILTLLVVQLAVYILYISYKIMGFIIEFYQGKVEKKLTIKAQFLSIALILYILGSTISFLTI